MVKVSEEKARIRLAKPLPLPSGELRVANSVILPSGFPVSLVSGTGRIAVDFDLPQESASNGAPTPYGSNSPVNRRPYRIELA